MWKAKEPVRSPQASFSRRSLLKGAGASLLALGARPALAATPDAGFTTLRARKASAQLLPEAEPATEVWAYEGMVPGPILRVPQGKSVKALLRNELDQDTSIHWHGIRIDNAMDGVVGLTQNGVKPGEDFAYEFTAPDAGTYWYHPHNRSWEQVARGLYGVLIVEESDPPQVERDIALVVDDWRLNEAGAIDEASMGSLHDRAHAGRLGNVLTLNGADIWEQPVRSGERIRLRLISTANARIMRLRLEEHNPWLIALDGQPVTPSPLAGGEIRLAPGQRADLMIDMELDPGSSAAISEVSAQGRLVAGHFLYHESEVVRSQPLDAPIALPAGKLPERTDTQGALEVPLLMEGGAMGGLTGAVYKGELLGIQELARNHGMAWAFNGIAGRTPEPLFEVEKGRPVVLRMVNETSWPHGIHIHGHHAQVFAPGEATPWRDTHLLDPQEEVAVAFVADNPGKWMIHCHMLEHQAAGMGTWFHVKG